MEQLAPKKHKIVEEEKKVLPHTKTMTTAQYMEHDVVMKECDSGKESKQGAMVLTEEE
ncbi:MAG: hypothetical protein ACKO7B_17115 [Flavobacteriales bacterium]